MFTPAEPEKLDKLDISEPIIAGLIMRMMYLNSQMVAHELAAEVCTIEVIEPLARRAAVDLPRLGYTRVQVRLGDGNDAAVADLERVAGHRRRQLRREFRRGLYYPMLQKQFFPWMQEFLHLFRISNKHQPAYCMVLTAQNNQLLLYLNSHCCRLHNHKLHFRI